jgi:2-amino-4-hydroxy-6-hydroxymethyldihydropteridine diphosphokinase
VSERAYVGLGSNIGDREGTLLGAVRALADDPSVEVVGISTFHDTEPVGVVDQPRFLNGAVALETDLPARDLLDLLLEIERRFGRVREGVPPQGPRTLDLDLLVYGDARIDEPGLRVPHPRLHERRFALEPLAELAPDLELPELGAVTEILSRVD